MLGLKAGGWSPDTWPAEGGGGGGGGGSEASKPGQSEEASTLSGLSCQTAKEPVEVIIWWGPWWWPWWSVGGTGGGPGAPSSTLQRHTDGHLELQ